MLWLIRFLLLFLLAVLVVRAGWRLISGIVDGAAKSRGVPQRGTPMVRDPVCGTFVVRARALSATAGGETAWFCSDACRVQWQTARQ